MESETEDRVEAGQTAARPAPYDILAIALRSAIRALGGWDLSRASLAAARRGLTASRFDRAVTGIMLGNLMLSGAASGALGGGILLTARNVDAGWILQPLFVLGWAVAVLPGCAMFVLVVWRSRARRPRAIRQSFVLNNLLVARSVRYASRAAWLLSLVTATVLVLLGVGK